MADDLQQTAVGDESPIDPQFPEGIFEGVLTALSAGEDVEIHIQKLQDTIRDAVLDAGGSEGAAIHAAETFTETLRSEVFDGNQSFVGAADYARQAMLTAIETYDPATQTLSASDALLSAIASGSGVEDAVARVVAEMGDTNADPDVSGQIESIFLDELQEALSRGEAPDVAVDSATTAAESGLGSLQQAAVPVDNPILNALAGGENVGDTLADAVQAAGGDADAFVEGLENSLADGVDAGQALTEAQTAASDTAATKKAAEVELGAADQLAAALASGEKVDEALDGAGGGDAFASALEDALANGAQAGDAMNQAGDAQARQDAVAQEQSVPLSAADQLAASLASGDNVDQVLQAAGGDENFAAALEQSLSEGAAPDSAMASGQQAASAAAATAQDQSVPLSPADQLAASLASGDNVDGALADAGGGDAFGAELEAALANGQSPDASMQEAASAQQTAQTTAAQQEVPADPAIQALAQGGDAAQSGDLADAVADVTGTTGEPAAQSTDTPAQQTQPETQTAETQDQPASAGTGGEESAPQTTQSAETSSEQPSGQPSSEEPAQTASETEEPSTTEETQTAESSQSTETTAEESTQSTEAQSAEEGNGTQTQTETAEESQEVAQAPGGETGTEEENASTEETVTETIQTASGEAAASDETEQGGGTDGNGGQTAGTGTGTGEPTAEEIAALQDIATAAGGNSGNPSSNLGFGELLNPSIGGSGLGGGNNQQSTQTGYQPAATGNSGGGGSDREDNSVVETNTVTPNSAPTAFDDTGTSQENSVLTVSVTGNDTDPDTDVLTVIAARVGPNSGTVTFAGGSITFDPGTDFDYLAVGEEAVVTIGYSISDGAGGGDQANLVIRVTGTNDAPTVTAVDGGLIGEDAITLSVDLLGTNFSDLDLTDTHTAINLAQTGGRFVLAVIDGSGNLSIAPGQFEDLDDGESEVLSFTYDVSDGTTTTQNTVSVTITGANDVPVVSAVSTSIGEDAGSISVDLLSGQADVDGEVLTAVSLNQTAGRTVSASIDGSGNLVFTPGQFEDLDDGESEVLSFTYDVSDGTTTTQNTVSVTITGANDAPVVSAVSTSIGEDAGSISVDLLSGQTDVDGEVLTAVSLNQTAGRTVSASIDGSGNLVFAPGQFEDLDDGESEVLSFTYDVSDGTTTTQNTVSVTITGANDAPTVSGVSTSVGEDAPSVTVNLLGGNASDSDTGDVLSAVNLTQNGGRDVGALIDGSGNLVFAGGQFEDLAAGQSEVLTFTYDVSDGTTTTQNTVSVTMTGANDAPVGLGIVTISNSDALELGGGTDGVEIPHDPAISIGGGTPFTVEIMVNPDSLGGLQTLIDKSDLGQVDSSPYRLHLEGDGALSIWNGSTLLVTAAGVVQTGQWQQISTSFDGSTMRVYVDGNEVYSGAFTVGGENTSPWNIGKDNQAGRNFDGLIDDVRFWDGARSEFEIQASAGVQIADPANEPGLLSYYTFDGSDGVTVADATGNGHTGTFTGSASVQNGAGIVSETVGSHVTVDENGFAAGFLIASDVDQDALTFSLSSDGANGTAVVNPDGTYSYTPNPGFDGADSFTVQVSDGKGGVTTQAVAVTVVDVNLAPIFVPDNTLVLDGVSGRVEIAHHADLNFNGGTPLTVEMWINPDDVSGLTVLADKSDQSAGDFSPFRAFIQNGSIGLWNGSSNLFSADTVSAGTWQHVAFSYDGATMSVYLDGQLTAQNAYSIGPENSFPWVIGDDTQADREFGGSMDDVRIWNTARSQLEIQSSMNAQLADPANEPGLVANLTFDGSDGITARDVTGNGHDGTFLAGASVGTEVGPSAEFNGTNAYIDVPDATVNGLTAGTIEAWVYLDSNNEEAIFTQQANGVNSLAIFRIGDGTPGQVLFQGSNQSGGIASNTTIPTGEWHHVAITFDSTQANLYIDGQHDASAGGNFSIVGASGGQITGTAIGAWLGDGNGRYFDGQMSEFRIWDNARSPAEIADNYNVAMTGSESGLRALYNFNDGFTTGGAVADATGNFDGTSVNTVSAGSADGYTMTTVIADENFEGGAVGWSNSTTADGGAVLTDFLGHFGNGASSDKTFTLNANATEATIGLDFLKIDSWDGEAFSILVDGQVVASRSFTSEGVMTDGVSADTVGVSVAQTGNHGDVFGQGWGEYTFHFDLTLTAAQIAALPTDGAGNPLLKLGFMSTLDQANTDEAWGVDNVSISATVPGGPIEAGSGTLQSNLLEGAVDPDGDDIDLANVNVASSNATRTVSFTVDNATGQFQFDTAQFANMGAGQSETVTVTYDVVDGNGGSTAATRSFTVHGSQNAISLGTADYVEIGHHADLEPGADSMTAEMWFYWPGAGEIGSLQFLMSKGNTDGSADPGYSMFVNSDTLVARTSTGSGQGELTLDMSGIDSGWHHVAMVIDQTSDPNTGQLSAYLDGSSAGWQIPAGGGYDDVWTNGDIASSSDSLMIGDPANSPGAQGTGYAYPMDEVRIWDSARSEAQINETMHQQLNGNEAGLNGYWTFNESVGSTVTDLTGNGHDGRMSDGADRENMIEVSISNNDVYKGLLLGSDEGGDQLSYNLADGPDHGSVSFDGNTFVYDHDGSGLSDSFTVEISDGTDTVTEHIDVTVV